MGKRVELIEVNDCLNLGTLIRIRGRALKRLRERVDRAGDLVTIRDNRGRDFRGRVVTLTAEYAETLIFESFRGSVDSFLEIYLLQALPKKERLEWIIQKTTELGVYAIVPFESDHSITLEERDRPQKKSHRWQAIATRAAQQCRRAVVPQIHLTVPFARALDFGCDTHLRILFWEKESSRGIRELLAEWKGRIQRLALMVGPEGGFSPREIELAREKGYVPVGLGERILRTETAAIAAVTLIQYELGDLGGRCAR